MVLVPADRNLEKISWVTNSKVQPNKIIFCQNCPGIIFFNLEELLQRKANGQSTSTPCRFCNYHPGFPPEPYLDYDGKLMLGPKERRIDFDHNV